MKTSKRATPLRPVTILPPSRAGSVTSTYFAFRPSASISAREVGLPISSSETNSWVMPSGGRAPSAQICAKRAIGQIGAALHVVDARAERAVAFDPEWQPLDEPHRMHGVEMAQHQNARRVLAP